MNKHRGQEEWERDMHICLMIEAETLLKLGDWDTKW